MVYAVEDILNQALRRLGNQTPIGNIWEGSRASRAGLELYGQTRDDLLRSKDWPFSQRDATLTLLKTAPPFGYNGQPWTSASPMLPWIYEYAYPASCIRVRSVRPAPVLMPQFDPAPSNFTIANDPTVNPSKVVLTNLANATAVITAQITDPGQWESMFVEALVDALARRLAIPIGGADAQGVQMKAGEEQQAVNAADRVQG